MLELGEWVEEGAEGKGNDDLSNVEIDKVDDENWDRGESWDEEFVSPADVEEVVTYTEDCDGL